MPLFRPDTTFAYVRPRRVLPRSLTPTTTTGTLSGVLPEVTASFSESSSSSAALSATLPELTSAITEVSKSSAVLSSTLPELTATIPESSKASGIIAAAIPELAASITESSKASSTLAGILPELSADIDLTAKATAVLGATLPELLGDIDVQAKSSAGLAALIPEFTADLDVTSQTSGLLSAAIPELSADIDVAARDSGPLGGLIPELTMSASMSVETEGWVLSAALPALTADVDAVGGDAGSFAALLPELAADIDGILDGLPEAQLFAILPMPTMSGQAVSRSDAVISASISMLTAAFAGDVETDEHGELSIVIPKLLMGVGYRKVLIMMERQRRLTRQFIDSSPIFIALTPATETRKASGGVMMVDGVPRPLQIFRLIPMSHTERPARSTSAVADGGVQRRYDFTLLGEWDSVMRENDHWITEDGQRLVIEALVSFNGYERKGLVISYGRDPSHVTE